MKKLFLSMLAAVTLFASCSEDEVVSQSNEETSAMTFTVSTSEIASRALGDGTAATSLYYAVYDETGETADMVESISKTTEAVTFNSSTNVSLNLLNGHTYSIIFWAESDNGMCTVDWDKKTISLKETLKSNQEDYDAFYAYVAPFKVTSSKTEAVKMYRPFAQMNIGTTSEDMTGLKAYYGSDITQTQLTIKTYTSMNLTTGEVIGESKEQTYTFGEFNTEDFPISDYQYLSMNYLLVNNEKELVDVTLKLGDEKATITTSKEFTSVPVQRNYRTNIYGQLFTSQTDWSVELLPEFEGAYTVLSGHVTLQEDMTIDKPLVVTSGDVVLDLNGKSITTTNGSDAIIVKEGTLTIKGEGSVTTEDNTAGYAVTADGSNAIVNIYGGTYTIGLDNVETYETIACNSAVYTKNGGKANIYGGTYQVSTTQTTDEESLTRFLINKNGKEGIEGGPITIYGGTFVKFNPANNVADGANTSFVATGYSSTKVGENQYVVAKGTGVATAEALTTAWKEEGEISLVTNIQLGAAPLILKDGEEVTIHLNGNTITAGTFAESNGNISTGDSDSYPFYVQGGTLTIEGEGNISAQAATYSMAVFATGGEVNIYGGYYTNAGHGSDLIYAKNAAVINIYGGTFKAVKDDGTESGTDQDYSALNLKDGSDATITVYGGSFYKFDPANNASEGAGTNFVATGYKSVQDSDWYNVVKE